MLTKLNELRRSKGILFIIATNYENRIDPAIKRSGRIDRKYLILPPDMEGRKEGRKRIISSLTGKDCPEELAKESYFLGCPDIQATAEKLGNCIPMLKKAFGERLRTARIEGYVSQLKEIPPPLEKFVCVRRHIIWNNLRPYLKEDLARLVQDIKRRICGIASAGSPSFSV